MDCGDEAADWLTTVLHRRCRLLRQNPQAQRLSHKPISPHNDRGTPLSLANEAQYLLISETSIQYLCSAVHERGRHDNLEVAECITRFRPNLVVSPSVASGNGCLEPYAEEEWERVKIGGAAFNVRCVCTHTPPTPHTTHTRAGYWWLPSVSASVCGSLQWWAESRTTQDPHGIKRK